MPIQRVPRYVLLLQELIKQICKVLNVQKEKQTNNSHQHQSRRKHHSSSKSRYHLKEELMFYKGLEEERKKIEQALTKFKSVARQIDSKIMEVSYKSHLQSQCRCLTCARRMNGFPKFFSFVFSFVVGRVQNICSIGWKIRLVKNTIYTQWHYSTRSYLYCSG